LIRPFDDAHYYHRGVGSVAVLSRIRIAFFNLYLSVKKRSTNSLPSRSPHRLKISRS
jgi:hypothetical protein